MEWLKQQGPWCPSLIEHLQASSPAVRRADLLHLSLRADGAGTRSRAGAQHPGVDRARRAGDPPRDLQGRLQQAGGALLPDRERARSSSTSSFPIVRCSRTWSASGVEICRSSQPYPRMPATGAEERAAAAVADDASRTVALAHRRGRRAAREFPSHLMHARRRVPPPSPPLRPDRALRRADRSRQGMRGADSSTSAST